MKELKDYKNKDFLKQNLMGPNVILLAAEALDKAPIGSAERILDLGCGTGLSSMYLAENSKATVYAMDLWIHSTENFKRFVEFGFEKRIVPIHADANDTPFADDFFDAAYSFDSYHYFGRNYEYLDKHLAPLVKKGGSIVIVIPGLKQELDYLPDEMAMSWTKEDIDTIRSLEYWRDIFSKSKLTEISSITEMDCYEVSWKDWLATDNPYAVSDRPAMEAGAGKYMNLICAVLKRI